MSGCKFICCWYLGEAGRTVVVPDAANSAYSMGAKSGSSWLGVFRPTLLLFPQKDACLRLLDFHTIMLAICAAFPPQFKMPAHTPLEIFPLYPFAPTSELLRFLMATLVLCRFMLASSLLWEGQHHPINALPSSPA
eukprot:4239589-Amphidinium_carterae.1